MQNHILKITLLTILSYAYALDNRPVIGVLSEPHPVNKEYIVSSYVKFVQQAGARVVPLLYTSSNEELKKKLNHLNGVLLPGGGADISPYRTRYYNATSFILEHAIELIDNGEIFPVWGTCLGWEEIAEFFSNNQSSVLDNSGKFDSEDLAIPVAFTEYALSKSRMFSKMPKRLVRALSNEHITYNSHSMGVEVDEFYRHKKLKQSFEILATSKDNNGKEFVAAAESTKYPGIFAVQFHPEKSQFEWLKNNIPHSEEAIAISQYFSNLFVSYAKKGENKFDSLSAKTKLNWMIEASGKRVFQGSSSYFFEYYEFNHEHQVERTTLLD